ncbi:MAG: flagellar biosynthesis anti-sigma factor FlgM [Synergistaceae bacterium]|jgi:negative regulator of flagellin synthesis FlgM|nr:flagellar biosynthesis anti-sigma factor FlgM [Synergistaceae bacterium]
MIEKINDISGVSPASGIKLKKGARQDETAFSQDGLAVSSFAREMANISNELAKIPDVREDRVGDLKRQIEEGSYSIDLDALAKRLVWAGINRIEE